MIVHLGYVGGTVVDTPAPTPTKAKDIRRYSMSDRQPSISRFFRPSTTPSTNYNDNANKSATAAEATEKKIFFQH